MERFIKNLARGAGAILREGFKKNVRVSLKGSRAYDVLTKYDLASNKFLIERIKKKLPAHGILTEESGSVKGSNRIWILDPIDGTRAFSRRIPFFCVNIAFVHNDKVIYAATYDPIHDELFFAAAGKGAFVNSEHARVRQVKDLEFAFGAIDSCSTSVWDKRRKVVQKLVYEQNLWDLTPPSGALSMAYVAVGRYDLGINLYGNPWDYAAASLLIKEAGGQVTDFAGKPYHWKSSSIIGANPVLLKKILKGLDNR